MIALVTMAAGLRVTIPRPPARLTRAAFSGPAFNGSGIVVPLIERRPKRQQSPELVDHLPTPLEPEAKRPAIVIDPMPLTSQSRIFWSINQILRYWAGWLRLKMKGQLDEQKHAEVTRQLFQRLNGAWIKAGQLLSLRTDLVSEVMARELGTLQYQARGFPPEVALQVVEEELGRPVSTVFSHFERMPFAAASIAQVHRATLLHNNRAVVVKVMRPDVADSFARDIKLLEFIVRWTTRLHLFSRLHLQDGIDEMRAILKEEVDYKYEAVNLKRMRRNLKQHNVFVPRLVSDLSRRRILVIEEVAGVLMSQFLQVRRRDPERAHRWAVLNGIEEKAVARRLSTTVLRQILEDNEFHGDLHPGNIMLLTENNIALIDFGSVGRLTQHTWDIYRASLGALSTRDYGRAADLMLMMSPSLGRANTSRLRADMTTALQNFELTSESPGLSYVERSMASMSKSVAKVMADHQVPVSWGIMRVGRSLSTLDASLQTLVPNEDFMSLVRVYFKDRQRRAWTLKGQRAAIRSVVTEIAAFGSDTKLLLATGVRDQALRLHGMLDRLTRVRIIVLTFVRRLVFLMIVLLVDVAVFDTYFHHLPENEHWHFLPDEVVHDAADVLPHMHPIYWILVIGLGAWLFRMLGAVRHSIVRH